MNTDDPPVGESRDLQHSTGARFHDRLWYWMALALALGMPLFLGRWLPLGDLYLTGGDEGIELTKAVYFAGAGGWPVEVWNDQPLTHTRLYAWMIGRWPGPIGPRWWSLGSLGLLLVSIYGFAYRQRPDRMVALVAVALVAFSPLVLDLSIAAMQEMPATAFGMASVGLVTRRDFTTDGRIRVLAVLAAATGLAIKLTAGVYALAGFLMLVRRFRAQDDVPAMTREGAWLVQPMGYAAGVAGVAAAALWWLDGRPIECYLASHWAALHAAAGVEYEGPWKHLVRLHPFLLCFFLWGGIVVLRARHNSSGVGWDTALLLGVVGLFNIGIRPWWEYYALSCWVAMAPVAAIGWVEAFRGGRAGHGRMTELNWRGLVAWGASCGAGIAGAYWVWSWAREVSNFRHSPRASSSRILEVVRRQAAMTSVGSIYSVDPIVGFWLGMRVPESLLVVTQKRYLSGDLNPAAVPSEVRRAKCDLVVIPQGLDLEKLPDWPVVLREDYVLVALVEGREIYVHQQRQPRRLDTRMRW
jgi:hypothetical protein